MLFLPPQHVGDTARASPGNGLNQAPMAHCILTIALDTPLNSCFDYRWPCEPGAEPLAGQLALVSFGRREVVGLIVAIGRQTDVPPDKLKDALAVRAQLAPLSAEWLALAAFAADYYQRPLGEVALPGLPKNLRVLTTVALDRAIKKLAKDDAVADSTAFDTPLLNPAQQLAADAIGGAAGFTPLLLYGVTGSGKTEVYLQACAQVLARDAQAQILILVPEINLTPQLEGNIRARFPGLMLATLHSSLSEGERMLHWLAAHQGRARIVLGTRLSILASLPHLKLIVIDEEHDPSYKQQEGLRYSARDLAVWRARQLAIPIVLGSATPSLESWHHAGSGRYRKLELRERAVKDAVLPRVKLLDMERDRPKDGLTSHLVAALRQRMERGEQSLLFLNRRGYAPVINCESCGWVSECTRCTSFMVLHKPEHRLRCHHCSLELRIPRHCPTCGNVDLQPMGRGTQRVEEGLQQMFPDARILRIDADSTRKKGSAQEAFDSVHRGEVDILIGTQMVAKGHDFKKLTLGRHPQSRHRAVFAGLPRQRAPVRAADAGGRPRRPRRPHRGWQRQRSADPDPLRLAPAVFGGGQSRLRPLRHRPAGRAQARRAAALSCTRPCCAPKRARSPPPSISSSRRATAWRSTASPSTTRSR